MTLPAPHPIRRLAAGTALSATAAASLAAIVAVTPAAYADTPGSYASRDTLTYDSSTASAPAKSQINVPDTISQLTTVNVTLDKLTDSGSTGASALLTAPNGAQSQLFSDNSGTYTGSGDVSFTPSEFAGQPGQGNWTLQLQDSTGTASISGWSLTVTEAPVVADSGQPQSQVVTSGNAASFTATAESLPAATVQWQKSTDGTSFADIPGATASTYTISNPTVADDNTFYRAVFTNSAGTATTNAASLNVNPSAPVVTSQPTSQSVLAGSPVTFNAAASGDPAPTVQWQESTDAGKSFNDITGATSPSYTVAAPALADSGDQFRAVFTNTANMATSAPATMTVTGAVPGAPTHVVAAQNGAKSARISWTAPANGGTPAMTAYSVGLARGQAGDGNAVPASQHSYTWTGLVPGVYQLSVAAINAAGMSNRIFVTVLIEKPTSTPTVSASASQLAAGAHLALWGSGPANATLTVQRQIGHGAWTKVASTKTNKYGAYTTFLAVSHNAGYRVVTSTGKASHAISVKVASYPAFTLKKVSGRTYTISGKVSPGVANQLVKVAAIVSGGKLVNVGSTRTSSTGAFGLRYTFKTAGMWTVDVTAQPTAANTSGSVIHETTVK